MKQGVSRRALRVLGRWACGRPRIRHLLPILALAALSGSASEGPSTAEQLERMSAALRTLSYEGVLVYAHDNRLETLRIVRRVENGRVHELLESLSGPLRMVTRDQEQVTCHLQDQSPILVHDQGPGADLLRPRAFDLEALEPYYVVHPLGAARVAGRQTHVVGIIPRDRMRYGYRFYLDTASGLPLKSDLMGTEAKPIEQLVFTSLTLDASQAVTPVPKLPARPKDPEPPSPASTGPWRFEDMPAGFGLVVADRSASTAGSNTEHYVLSDGLASVSVYIEQGVDDGLEGGSRIGAVHAVGGRIAGHQVTVVGEVPAATVQSVLAGIAHEEGLVE